MANIELPKDAEGRDIPLDTEVLYDKDGERIDISRYQYYPVVGSGYWNIKSVRNKFYHPSKVHLTPPDSWGKLLEDLKNAADAANRSLNASCCTWFNDDKGCVDCPADEVNDETCGSQFINDIAARIRKLRGEER